MTGKAIENGVAAATEGALFRAARDWSPALADQALRVEGHHPNEPAGDTNLSAPTWLFRRRTHQAQSKAGNYKTTPEWLRDHGGISIDLRLRVWRKCIVNGYDIHQDVAYDDADNPIVNVACTGTEAEIKEVISQECVRELQQYPNGRRALLHALDTAGCWRNRPALRQLGRTDILRGMTARDADLLKVAISEVRRRNLLQDFMKNTPDLSDSIQASRVWEFVVADVLEAAGSAHGLGVEDRSARFDDLAILVRSGGKPANPSEKFETLLGEGDSELIRVCADNGLTVSCCTGEADCRMLVHEAIRSNMPDVLDALHEQGLSPELAVPATAIRPITNESNSRDENVFHDPVPLAAAIASPDMAEHIQQTRETAKQTVQPDQNDETTLSPGIRPF